MLFGVIRPGWAVAGEANAYAGHRHCFYYTYDGFRRPSYIDWEGRQGAVEQGDRIGMLLDLDQGSTTVWKNNVRLGAERSALLGGLAVQAGRQRAHRVLAAARAAAVKKNNTC